MNPAPIGFFKPVERFYLFVSLIALLVLGLLITTLAFENYFFLIRCGAICMRLQVPLLYTILPGSLLILFGVVGLVTNFSFAAKRSFQFDKLGFVSGLAMIGLGASLEFDSHSSLLACSRSNELRWYSDRCASNRTCLPWFDFLRRFSSEGCVIWKSGIPEILSSASILGYHHHRRLLDISGIQSDTRLLQRVFHAVRAHRLSQHTRQHLHHRMGLVDG